MVYALRQEFAQKFHLVIFAFLRHLSQTHLESRQLHSHLLRPLSKDLYLSSHVSKFLYVHDPLFLDSSNYLYVHGPLSWHVSKRLNAHVPLSWHVSKCPSVNDHVPRDHVQYDHDCESILHRQGDSDLLQNAKS